MFDLDYELGTVRLRTLIVFGCKLALAALPAAAIFLAGYVWLTVLLNYMMRIL